MSGHSKWAGIKHKKMLMDTKRGKIFNKIIRDIISAVKYGGTQVENNTRLKKAIANAKAANMPQENIKKAIQRSIGNLKETHYEEVNYEGYGPFGIAVIVNVLTNNKNRTTSDLRKIFSIYHGSLVHNGCVSWLFDKKGCILISKTTINEDKLINIVFETHMNNDVNIELVDNMYELIVPLNKLDSIKKNLLMQNIILFKTSIKMIPKTKITRNNNADKQLFNDFLNTLNEYEDIIGIYTNFSVQ
jgi:YebC/PmpR family DNA-binding regulatory protein